MVASTQPDQRPVLGWLVDPLLGLQESGVECISNAPPSKWQWRADDFRVEEQSDEGREESIEESINNGREGAAEDGRDAGSTSEAASPDKKKRSIFRKLRHKIRHTRVSSTDAIMSQVDEASIEKEEASVTSERPARIMARRNTPIFPSMIHLQQASSRDSVECVLADVFMLPSASSNLTEDCDFSSVGSVASTGTVVIDEQAMQVDLSHVQALPPCSIHVPTEGEAQSLLQEKEASSLPSTSSSVLTAQDSGSDEEERMAELSTMTEEEQREGPADRPRKYSSVSEQSSQYSICSHKDLDPSTNLDLMLMEMSDDESSAAKSGDLDSYHRLELICQERQEQDEALQCVPVFCYSCCAGDQVTNVDEVRYLRIQPSSRTLDEETSVSSASESRE